MAVNRRDFLKLMGAGAALVSSPVLQALASPALPTTLRPPLAATEQDPIIHMLNRVSFGARPGQVEAVRKMGLQAFLDQQLDPASLDDSASEARLGDLITLDMTPAEMIAAGKTKRDVIIELDSATVMRAIYSQRQLFEVMVNFWSEHFSIYHQKGACDLLKTADDRDVIRQHAIGNFRDLLGASAKSPAMLIYLDNAESRKEHPNENYAREVMELHTVTIGSYTEQDVKEVARCFTGWSVRGLREQDAGSFIFRPRLHDNRQKTVIGHVIPAGGGIKDGEQVLDILAAHPNTAKHLASKLCRRFIADDPPAAVVERVAQTYLSTGGDIKSMLRVIFASDEFLNAPPKFKRPFEYMISLARAFDVDNNGMLRPVVLQQLKAMGHLPFDWVTPNGYSDYSAEWMDNLLLRWNLAIQMVYGTVRGMKIDVIKLARSNGAIMTARGVLDFYAQHLLGRPFSVPELDALWQFAARNGEPALNNPAGRRTLIDAIALIAASPAYQYR